MTDKPTIRELIRKACVFDVPLAERVEAVLRLEPASRGKDAEGHTHSFDKGYNTALEHVREALDGRED